MKQPQILFLILGVCAIGIVVSGAIVAGQSATDGNPRESICEELYRLAAKAQAYRARSFEASGGDGTFIGLTSLGITRLTSTPATPFGKFVITKNGNPEFVEFMAVGNGPGIDHRLPITMVMRVFADSVSLTVLN